MTKIILILVTIFVSQSTLADTWFNLQPDENYTIQLTSPTKSRRFAERVLRDVFSDLNPRTLAFENGKYTSIVGSFATTDEATVVMEELPESAKTYRPIIVTVGGLKGLGLSDVVATMANQVEYTEVPAETTGDTSAVTPINPESFGPVPVAIQQPVDDAVGELTDNLPAVDEDDTQESESLLTSVRNILSGSDEPAEKTIENLPTADVPPVTEQENGLGFTNVVQPDQNITDTTDTSASSTGTNPVVADPMASISPASPPPQQSIVPRPQSAGYNEPAVPSYRNDVFEELVIDPVDGLTEIIDVSMDHLNRIRTNFKEPQVHTSGEVDTKIIGSTIYLNALSQEPVALYISDGGAEETVVALTLTPKRKYPPQQVYVNTSKAKNRPPESTTVEGDTKKATAYETRNPYTQVLMDLLKTVADGEIPSGYTMKEATYQDPQPYCGQPGMAYRFQFPGQILAGNSFTVAVGVATNLSGRRMEAKEEYCVNDQTAAISFWPEVLLEHGQSTEIYVVLKNWAVEQAQQTKTRPKLLGQ